MKIYAFHLLNDYSGSPKVLMQLIKGWQKAGITVTVAHSTGRSGFLSDIENVSYRPYWYRWAANPFVRLFNLVVSQIVLILNFAFIINKEDLIYVNTVLPFGAAILGKICGCRVIYHIHETSTRPAIFKKFLFLVLRYTASDVVYASRYLSQQEPIHGPTTHILPNALEANFFKSAQMVKKRCLVPRNVLMICSLKAYKGVYEFVKLAVRHPGLQFDLVLNASEKDIRTFFSKIFTPNNLMLYPAQQNVRDFYERADIVLNLSRPDAWIETFGLTIIEAMAYGIPTIVPPVGGIADLINEGINGYHADSRDIADVSKKLVLLTDPARYTVMQMAARSSALQFSEEKFLFASLEILGLVPHGISFHVMEKVGLTPAVLPR